VAHRLDELVLALVEPLLLGDVAERHRDAREPSVPLDHGRDGRGQGPRADLHVLADIGAARIGLVPAHEVERVEAERLLQPVPNVGNARAGRTWEQDGYVAHVRGIFDDDGRLMVVINWNTDQGDAWERAEQPDYPLKYSTYAFQMGVNFIVYAMSH
jgi:hypothetical protein